MRRVERRRDDVLEPPRVEIRRDLEQQRTARLGLVARGDHARDQIVKRLAPLQVAQAGRVGRGDVEGQIVGERGEGPDAKHIVRDAVGGVLVGADVDADHALAAAALSRARARSKPSLLKPKRLMTAASSRRRNRRGPGVAVLRPRRQRADLDEAEAEAQHRARNLGVLVEAGGEAERIGKSQSQGLDRKPRIGGRRLSPAARSSAR